MKNILIAIALIIGINYSCNQPGPQQGNKVPIEDIFDNPGKYENELVTIEGIVTQYVRGTTQTTSFFTVQSDYGSIITVNTSAVAPKVLKKYKISGVVVIDQVTRRPVIIEQNRWVDPLEKLIPYLIGLVALLIVFLVIYLIVNRKRSENKSYGSADQAGPSGGPSASGDGKSSGSDTEYETIRISKESPKTVKIIPGRFEIIAGADKGKSFQMSGLPTSDGIIVTLGRSRNSNIQFFEKTVSRQQAELIYVNEKLFVKNLSHTNNTQVDGVELEVEETKELRFGSVIKAGEVEFMYNK